MEKENKLHPLVAKLIEQREAKGWTQADLAEKLGLPELGGKQQISRWERGGRGGRVPPLDVIEQMGRLFGLKLVWTLGDDDLENK